MSFTRADIDREHRRRRENQVKSPWPDPAPLMRDLDSRCIALDLFFEGLHKHFVEAVINNKAAHWKVAAENIAALLVCGLEKPSRHAVR